MMMHLVLYCNFWPMKSYYHLSSEPLLTVIIYMEYPVPAVPKAFHGGKGGESVERASKAARVNILKEAPPQSEGRGCPHFRHSFL